MFDGVSIADPPFQPTGIPSLGFRQSSHSPANDRHLEIPPNYDAAIQVNTQLKTRVSELEVINELYRSTLAQYQQGQPAPPAEMNSHSGESQLRQLLQDSQRREEELKKRVDELENEIIELRGDQPPSKKQRVSEYPEPPSDFGTGATH